MRHYNGVDAEGNAFGPPIAGGPVVRAYLGSVVTPVCASWWQQPPNSAAHPARLATASDGKYRCGRGIAEFAATS